MIDAARIEKFCTLLDHFCRVVDLLPAIDAIDPDDANEIAGIEVIYAELDKTGDEIDALLGRNH